MKTLVKICVRDILKSKGISLTRRIVYGEMEQRLKLLCEYKVQDEIDILKLSWSIRCKMRLTFSS